MLTKSHWQNVWEETSNTNKLKAIKTSIAPWKPPSNILIRRHEEVVICTARTRIGHSRLTRLHLMTKEDCPICELCDKKLTTKHITLYNAPSSTAPDKFSETHQQELQKNIRFFHKFMLTKIIVKKNISRTPSTVKHITYGVVI